MLQFQFTISNKDLVSFIHGFKYTFTCVFCNINIGADVICTYISFKMHKAITLYFNLVHFVTHIK